MFLRGLSLGALIGAAVVGSTLFRRRRHEPGTGALASNPAESARGAAWAAIEGPSAAETADGGAESAVQS